MSFLRNIYCFVFVGVICVHNVFATNGGGESRF